MKIKESAGADQAAIDLDLEMIDLYHPTPGFKIPFGQQGSQESRVAYMQLYVNNLLGDYGKGSTAVVSYKDVFNGMDRYEVVLTLGSETRTTMVVSYDLSAEETALAAINEADVGDMGTAITTNAEVLGLTLTDYTALTDKAPVHTALVDKSFADKAAVKSAFDTAVEAQKSAEAGQLKAEALANVNAYFTSENYKYAEAPGALDEDLATLGLDIGPDSAYAALDERDEGGKERLTAVMYDLMHNKPEGGYDQGTLITYFNEIVVTRSLTQESMNMVLAAKDANSIETLKDLDFVNILLNRFKDETLSYTKHSNKPFSTKVDELQPIVDKYGELEATQQVAVLEELLGKIVNRSQDTIDEFAAILDAVESTGE